MEKVKLMTFVSLTYLCGLARGQGRPIPDDYLPDDSGYSRKGEMAATAARAAPSEYDSKSEYHPHRPTPKLSPPPGSQVQAQRQRQHQYSEKHSPSKLSQFQDQSQFQSLGKGFGILGFIRLIQDQSQFQGNYGGSAQYQTQSQYQSAGGSNDGGQGSPRGTKSSKNGKPPATDTDALAESLELESSVSDLANRFPIVTALLSGPSPETE